MSWINYVSVVLAGLLSLGSFLAGWSINGNRWEDRYTAYKSQVEATAKEQQTKTDALVKNQERITQSTKETYEARIAALKSYYGRVQHNPTSGSGAVSEVPESTSGTDGSSSDLTLGCALTTQQLISLQEWVSKQSKE